MSWTKKKASPAFSALGSLAARPSIDEERSYISAASGPNAIAAFNKRHMEEFGHVREGEMPEITGVRLVSHVDTPVPAITRGFGAPTVAAGAARSRRANLGGGYQETHVFLGSDLKPGHEVPGPAIIEETFTTIVVYPGWKARVDDAGDYELTRVASRRPGLDTMS
jgi:N-methylhydantoinase A